MPAENNYLDSSVDLQVLVWRPEVVLVQVRIVKLTSSNGSVAY